MDETVQKGIGFQKNPARNVIEKNVITEMKKLLSGAFLSRIGTPVLFQSLDGDALGIILEKAMHQAIISAATRLGINIGGVKLADKLGNHVRRSLDVNIMSFGARALLERGRSMAANAFMEFQRKHSDLEGQTLVLSADTDSRVVLGIEGS